MHAIPLVSGEGGEMVGGAGRGEQTGTCDLHVTWGCEKTQLSRISEKLKLAVFPSQIHHLQQTGEKTITPGCQTQGNLSGCLHSEGKCSVLLNPWSSGQDNPLEAIGAWRLPRESNDLKKGAPTSGSWMKPVSEWDYWANLDLAPAILSRAHKFSHIQPQKPPAKSAKSRRRQFCLNATTKLNCFSGGKTTQGMDNSFLGPMFNKCLFSATLSHIKMNYCL